MFTEVVISLCALFETRNLEYVFNCHSGL
jgi:hypothetical protein